MTERQVRLRPTEVVVDLKSMGQSDYVILIPKLLVGDGEPGDAFPLHFQQWLRKMASIGFQPIDFGAADSGTHIELWMQHSADRLDLVMQSTENFIACGGDV